MKLIVCDPELVSLLAPNQVQNFFDVQLQGKTQYYNKERVRVKMMRLLWKVGGNLMKNVWQHHEGRISRTTICE